jgi:hypothetical protein
MRHHLVSLFVHSWGYLIRSFPPFGKLSRVVNLCKGSFAGKRGDLVASHRYFSRVQRITVTAQPKPKALGVGSAAAGDGG